MGATRSDSSPPGRDRRGSGEIFLGSVARRGSWCRLFEPGAHDADGGSGKTAVGPVVARKSSIEVGQKKLVKNRRKKERKRVKGRRVRSPKQGKAPLAKKGRHGACGTRGTGSKMTGEKEKRKQMARDARLEGTRVRGAA